MHTHQHTNPYYEYPYNLNVAHAHALAHTHTRVHPYIFSNITWKSSVQLYDLSENVQGTNNFTSFLWLYS